MPIPVAVETKESDRFISKVRVSVTSPHLVVQTYRPCSLCMACGSHGSSPKQWQSETSYTHVCSGLKIITTRSQRQAKQTSQKKLLRGHTHTYA